MELHCKKCSGRVFLDRTHSNYGHVEFFCMRCGKRWDIHRDTIIAKYFTQLEKVRRSCYIGNSNLLFS